MKENVLVIDEKFDSETCEKISTELGDDGSMYDNREFIRLLCGQLK